MKARAGEFYSQAREILAALGNRAPSQDDVQTVAEGLRNAYNMADRREHGVCVWCKQPSEGNRFIHRDGPSDGPLVPLCDRCAKGRFPEAKEIWARLAMERAQEIKS